MTLFAPDQVSGVLTEFEKSVPEDYKALIRSSRGAVPKLIERLLKDIPPDSITNPKNQRIWELCALFLTENQGRLPEALRVLRAMYYQETRAELAGANRINKGTPLHWMGVIHQLLGHHVIARKFAMLSLMGDAVILKGAVRPEDTGSFHRLVFTFGLPHKLYERYSVEAFKRASSDRRLGIFPEWILQGLDMEWMVGYPAANEVDLYPVNRLYVNELVGRLSKDKSGRNLETLAQYLLSEMPGCRAHLRLKSGSTDYDVICEIDGIHQDFRSELGRYFIAECKNWKEPADFAAFAKFCRVLDSTKSRFGILFSKRGITGQRRNRDAQLEQIKVFQDRGVVIVVVDLNDLKKLAEIESGATLTSMLRRKYLEVRLNLSGQNWERASGNKA